MKHVFLLFLVFFVIIASMITKTNAKDTEVHNRQISDGRIRQQQFVGVIFYHIV